MIIEKDNILKQWIVWKENKNSLFELFRAKTKRECKNWLESKNKK